MAALVQGFPADWPFQGSKTAQYRQVGNALPPAVAKAVGDQIRECLCADKGADVLRYSSASADGEPPLKRAA